MKRISTLLIILSCSILPLSGQNPIDYRFERVRGKVTVSASAAETRAAAGSVAHAGDRVRTGWRGYALLEESRHAARFEVFAGSDVTLAGDAPGVLLSLERGRLRAIFDKITGEEPRIVRTPGALLAVRGTRYGIEVGRDGLAVLSVFEGIVEVRSPLRPEPLLVRTGEACRFGMNRAPVASPMPRSMTEEMWQKNGSGMGGGMTPRGDGTDGMSGSHGATPRPNPGTGHKGH